MHCEVRLDRHAAKHLSVARHVHSTQTHAMVNSVLKKLSQPHISSDSIADALERHIGDGQNEYVCQQAFEALKRVKKQVKLVPAYVVIALSCPDATYLARV